MFNYIKKREIQITMIGGMKYSGMDIVDTDFDGFFAVCHFCLPTQIFSHDKDN